MNIEAEIATIKQILQRIERNSRPIETWVLGSWIMEITGWDHRKLQKARESGVIKWRKNKKKGGDPQYLLQSVPDEFKIKHQ